MAGPDRFVKVSAPNTYAAALCARFATAQKECGQQQKMPASDPRCALPVIALQIFICDRFMGAPLVSSVAMTRSGRDNDSGKQSPENQTILRKSEVVHTHAAGRFGRGMRRRRA